MPTFDRSQYSLAYMQVQMASMSLLVMGAWAIVKDYEAIMEKGLWHNVNGVAMVVSGQFCVWFSCPSPNFLPSNSSLR